MVDSNVCLVLVEDDEGHRMLIEKNLRRAGVNNPLRTFENGLEAVTFLRDHHNTSNPSPLLVLLDLNMPVMDGYQTLTIIKGDPVLRTTPVIVLTTSDNPSEVSKAYELGCNVFITKPVDYQVFSSTVKTLAGFVSLMKTPGISKHS